MRRLIHIWRGRHWHRTLQSVDEFTCVLDAKNMNHKGHLCTIGQWTWADYVHTMDHIIKIDNVRSSNARITKNRYLRIFPLLCVWKINELTNFHDRNRRSSTTTSIWFYQCSRSIYGHWNEYIKINYEMVVTEFCARTRTLNIWITKYRNPFSRII